MSSELDQLEPKLSDDDEHYETTAAKRPSHGKEKQRPQSEKRQRRQRQQPEISVEEYVQALLDEQRKRASRSQYGKANKCKRQIQSLRHDIQHRNMNILKKKFEQEQKQIRRARKQQQAEMDAVWLEIAQSYEEKCSMMLQNWEIKRRKDLKNLEIQLNQPSKQRYFSKDLVALQKTQQRLASQENYEEAGKVHQSIKKLERQIAHKHSSNFNTKAQHLEQQLRSRHKKQYTALMKKITSGREQQQLMYERQQKKLDLKFENILRQHRQQQQVEMLKIDKYNKTQNVMNLSRLDASWIVNNSHI